MNSQRFQRLNFAEIARLIAPDMPFWLPAHLEWWAQGIRHDILADEFRPTRRQTVERLSEFSSALAAVRRNLEDPNIRNILAAAGNTTIIGVSIATLNELAQRAENALASPSFAGKDGKAKRGRGKPAVPDIFTAKAICAARVIEAWRFFRGEDPGLGNLVAARAAHAYWLAAGGKSEGYGNPLNGWYDHFKTVKSNEHAPGLKRLIWRRDLQQSVQRGRQPWYLGTYFPVESAEFKSSVPIE